MNRVRDSRVPVSTQNARFRVGGYINRAYKFPTMAQAVAFRPPDFDIIPSPGTGNTVLDGKYMVDVEVKDFKKRLASGDLIPTNPMSSSNSALGVGYWAVCSFRRFDRASPVVYWTNRWLFVSEHNLKLANYSPNYQAMLQSARARAAIAYMDLLTSSSELGKTVSMIVGFKRRVREMVDSLVKAWAAKNRKKKFRSLKAALEDIASFWLEYRYGWRILWYEYNSLVDVVNATLEGTYRKSFRETLLLPTNELVDSVTRDGFVVRRTIVTTGTARAGVTAGATLNQRFALDPLTTAWELLPLSFVLDWFWNIGDALTANSPFSRVREEDCWRSIKRQAFAFVDITPAPLPGADYELMRFETGRSGDGYPFVEDYSRVRLDPGIDISPRLNLSPLKALDMGSLVVVLHRQIANVIGYNQSRR